MTQEGQKGLPEGRVYADALREMSLRYNRLVLDISILCEIDEFDDPHLEFSEICTRLVETIASGLAVENCSLALLDDSGEFIEIRAASSPFEYSAKYFAAGEWKGTKFRRDQGVLGKVVQSGKPLRIDDVHVHSDFVHLRNSAVDVRSLMCFPVQVQGRTIGAINLSHLSPGFFTVETEKTLELVANRAGRLLSSHLLLRQLQDAEKAHERLVTAIEQAAESIVITDSKGTIEYVNPAFERITGYSREEVMGQNPRLLKSGKQDEATYAQLWQTIVSGNVWSGCLINRKKDGTLFEEELTISPVRNSENEISNFVAVKRDVTQVVALENQLRQAQKMEAIGQLAGGVAHDFNNLLQAIRGFAELAMHGIPKYHEGREHLTEVLNAAERASSLTRQLLTFSRREVHQPQDINLNTVIAEMMRMVRRIIGEHIELTVETDPHLQTVHADEGQIGQVLINLCVNARDAMPEGGQLTVKTSNVVLDQPIAGINSERRSGNYVCVSVSDTGIGMSAETQARIFEPFFTTKEVGKGTGMGLATAYGIVEQHEGMLTVDSEKGKGSTFTFYLPTVDRDPAVPTAKMASTESRGRGQTILLAEDEASVRNLVVRVLTDSGYNVLATNDGEETLAVFRQNVGTIDMAILDVVMPRLSGRSVCEQIRALKPDLPVLFSSGYSVELVDHRFLVENGARSIQKPYSPDELLRAVEATLSGT